MWLSGVLTRTATLSAKRLDVVPLMRWILYPVFALISLAVVATASLATALIIAWPKLPSLEVLTDYRPHIPMRVFTSDGQLLDEFGEERRDFARIEDVPPTVIQAILAAEDERFYEHHGVDPVGIARAAVANLTSGERGQGASTITMQVARNFFLTREKTYNRKLYEILLSLKIERSLTKDEILEVYLNQIFLGHRAYGFSAAARTYFDKTLNDLTVAEAAMLAGLPKAPSAYNPVSNLRRSTLRQQYVLRRMFEAGFIDQSTFDTARAEPLQLAFNRGRRDASAGGDFVAEMARRIALAQYGEEAYNLGLQVITTVSSADQAAAKTAVRKGALDFDRRRGYRGPEAIVDLSGINDNDEEFLLQHLAKHRDLGDLRVAVVLAASPTKVRAYLNGRIIEISGKGLEFAAPMLAERAPRDKRIVRGAIIRVINKGEAGWEISQLPEVEAAIVAIDANTGAVRALVGGFDFQRSHFNNAVQAVRQPGSALKPFIYSAAIEKGFSPASYVEDSPLFFPAEVTGSRPWEPKNYDGKYDGLITVREALARSKNLVSVRLLQAATPAYTQDYLARFGFNPANHPPFLTMALGAGQATPWELAAGYAVFANGGHRIEPFIVQAILDSEGRTLARINPPVAGDSAPRVIDPRNAWLIDSMLRDVIRSGTGARARSLGRSDIAGKTGTTNDYVDAWFAGYNPDVVAVSWVGYPQPRNLGRAETGGRAALPIWIDYMSHALKGLPEKTHPRPPGLLPIQHPGSQLTDWYYQEHAAPAPPVQEETLPDIPELRYFIEGQSQWQAAPPPVPPAAPRAPAPVEERSFGFGGR